MGVHLAAAEGALDLEPPAVGQRQEVRRLPAQERVHRPRLGEDDEAEAAVAAGRRPALGLLVPAVLLHPGRLHGRELAEERDQLLLSDVLRHAADEDLPALEEVAALVAGPVPGLLGHGVGGAQGAAVGWPEGRPARRPPGVRRGPRAGADEAQLGRVRRRLPSLPLQQDLVELLAVVVRGRGRARAPTSRVWPLPLAWRQPGLPRLRAERLHVWLLRACHRGPGPAKR
mmetsp:Transcript_42006/g.124646  ORF Transcript_42006/g.124646 Transcript_42006/m.124646 type:complete len:229 (-) Transcript_42006:59-745(-)